MQPRALDEWIPELTGPVIPPRQRPLSPAEHHQLASQVANWLAEGVIEARRTRSPLNNNLVFVAKATGGIRVCDDCTPVNAVTKDFDWPLPRLQDIRFKLAGSRWFSRLDLKNAFFRIRVPGKYRHYTAFTCGQIQYQFCRMPFGVKTGPSVFQMFMDNRLSGVLAYVVIYIDDILIHARDLGTLRHRTKLVFAALRAARCEINQDKSEYEKQSILFAGVRFNAEGLRPNELKVRDVLSLPVPTTKSDMQSALGLVSYLRDFIPLMAHFTALLYPTKDGALLSPEAYRESWGKLLRHIYSAVASLRHWDDNANADLYTDASGHGLGVVLIQNGRIVALAARKLTPAETRYSATDREHLGLVYAAKKFKVFLHRVVGVTQVHSDHEALVGKRSTDMTPRQWRWHSIVSQWIPNACHVPGIKNPADLISRWGLEIEGGVEKL